MSTPGRPGRRGNPRRRTTLAPRLVNRSHCKNVWIRRRIADGVALRVFVTRGGNKHRACLERSDHGLVVSAGRFRPPKLMLITLGPACRAETNPEVRLPGRVVEVVAPQRRARVDPFRANAVQSRRCSGRDHRPVIVLGGQCDVLCVEHERVRTACEVWVRASSAAVEDRDREPSATRRNLGSRPLRRRAKSQVGDARGSVNA